METEPRPTEIRAEQLADIRTVIIPALAQHEGIYALCVKLDWHCPECGRERGEIKEGYSYDGSRRLSVSMWLNPCGHIDKYSDVRNEAFHNGLNNLIQPAPDAPETGSEAGDDIPPRPIDDGSNTWKMFRSILVSVHDRANDASWKDYHNDHAKNDLNDLFDVIAAYSKELRDTQSRLQTAERALAEVRGLCGEAVDFCLEIREYYGVKRLSKAHSEEQFIEKLRQAARKEQP